MPVSTATEMVNATTSCEGFAVKVGLPVTALHAFWTSRRPVDVQMNLATSRKHRQLSAVP